MLLSLNLCIKTHLLRTKCCSMFLLSFTLASSLGYKAFSKKVITSLKSCFLRMFQTGMAIVGSEPVNL